MNRNTILFVTLSIALLTSCLQGEDLATPITPENVSASLNGSLWKITYFYDSDHEETAHFAGYSFEFAENGSLTATKGSQTVTGTWFMGNDDSTPKLYLSFGGPDSFEELSDDWHILEFSDTLIKLRDISGGNGGTDYLNFERM